MDVLSSKIWFYLSLFLLFNSIAIAQDAVPDKKSRGKYTTIEVSRFEVTQGSSIPENVINLIMLEIVDEMYKLKAFQRIIRPNIKNEFEGTNDTGPKVRLTGTILKYDAGINLEKYTVSIPSIGTKAKAKIKFLDLATGTVLLEKEVGGSDLLPFPGQLTNDATRKLAKEVAKITKKNFF